MRNERKLLTVPGLLVLVALIAVVISGLSQTSHARPADQEATAPLGKIAPWVMEHTAGGGQAEFLIVLADQADLSGAEALPTKLEKGRYVRDALWSKAQSTQAPLLAQLAARHIEHRSYYIVNLIWVKGDRNLALDLAARPDVARIEANPQIPNIKYPIPNLWPLASNLQFPNGIEPNIAYVHAPDVWALGFTGQGIVVGGQDTGYDWSHPALKPHYRGWRWRDRYPRLQLARCDSRQLARRQCLRRQFACAVRRPQSWHAHDGHGGGRRWRGQSDRHGPRRKMDRLPQYG